MENNNEVLFWKVFRNVWLMKNISDWKFRDIVSLNSMLRNKQYELLKYKINSNSKIIVEGKGLELMINYYRSTDDILLLLLENKQSELLQFGDLFNKMIDSNSPSITKVLLNEPYSVEISNEMLESAICKSPLPVLEVMINHLPSSFEVPDKIKNNSIKLVVQNYWKTECSGEKIEFLLNNPRFKITNETEQPISLPSSSPTHIRKKIKVSSKESSKEIKNNQDDGLIAEEFKIKLEDCDRIKSDDLLNRLLNLGYIDLNEIKSNNLNQELDTILNNNGGIKEIFKLASKYSDGIFRVYLSRYGCNDDIQTLDNSRSKFFYYGFAIRSFNTNALKLILSNQDILINKNHTSHYYPSDFNKYEPDIEFILYYLSNYKDNLLKVDNAVIKFLKSYKSKIGNDEVYKTTILNYIEKDNSLNQDPNKWFTILDNFQTNKYQIDNIEKVDWMADHHHTEIECYNYSFKDASIFEYAKEKFKPIPHLYSIFTDDRSKETLFLNSIDNCNIEVLKEIIKLLHSDSKLIENLQWKIRYYSEEDDDEDDDEEKAKNRDYSIDLTNLKQFLDYLYSINYDLFTPESFKKLIIRINGNIVIQQDKQQVDLSNLVINFNQSNKDSIFLFVESMTGTISPNLLQLMLNNNFNPIINDFDQFNNQWIESSSDDRIDESNETDYYPDNGIFHYHTCLFYKSSDGCSIIGPFCCNSLESIQDITSCIEIILNQQQGSEFKRQNEMIITIINHLYKRLIRVKDVNFEQINYIHQLVANRIEGFTFQRSLFHSFYYLCIKSKQLIQFIMDFEPIQDFVINGDDNDYDHINAEEFNYFFNIKDFINPNEFSFEYIFNDNTSINDVFQLLITSLIITPTLNRSESFEEFTSYETAMLSALTNLLKLNRIELFFKQLEIIQTHLSDPSFPPFQNKAEFSFSESLFYEAQLKLNTELFSKFLNFNSGESAKSMLLFKQDYYHGSRTNVKCFLKHYDSISKVVINHYNMISIDKNYWNDIVFKSKKFEDTTNHNILEFYHQFNHLKPFETLLKSTFKENQTPKDNYNTFRLNPFSIDFREAVIKVYPPNEYDEFKITPETITIAYNNNDHYFLKYYYNNGTIKNDIILLQHLKSLISSTATTTITQTNNNNYNWFY